MPSNIFLSSNLSSIPQVKVGPPKRVVFNVKYLTIHLKTTISQNIYQLIITKIKLYFTIHNIQFQQNTHTSKSPKIHLLILASMKFNSHQNPHNYRNILGKYRILYISMGAGEQIILKSFNPY